MDRRTKRDEIQLTGSDYLVVGLAAIGAELGLQSRSAVNSFVARHDFVGKDDQWVSTHSSLTSPGLIKLENQRRFRAQSGNGRRSVDGRPRDAQGRLMKAVGATLVPQD